MKKIFIISISVAAIFLFPVFNNKVLGVESDCESLCASDARLSKNLDLDKCIANCDEVLNKIPDLCDELCQSDVNNNPSIDKNECVDQCSIALIELSSHQDIQNDCTQYCIDSGLTGALLNQCVDPCVEHRTALLSKIEILSTTPSASTTSGGIFEFPNPLGITTVQELLKAILRWMFIFSIPITIFFIIYAGFLFMTSGGNTKKLDQAKKTILYALIGFAIILLANSIPYLINNILGGKTNSTATPTTTSGSVTKDGTPTGSENGSLMACYSDCADQFTNSTDSEAGALAQYTQCQYDCDAQYQGTP